MLEMTPITLATTAVSLGFIHTLLGPDHYVPFIALARSNRWSLRKTLLISTICGFAHCLSSVAIGLVGIAAGVALVKLEIIEGVRGDIASYLMIAFGLAYFAWAWRRYRKGKVHTHIHRHGEHMHVHSHDHAEEHTHAHGAASKSSNLYWGIFIVFLFGPCEPLIPLLMYPAAKENFLLTWIVAGIFTIVTVSTMLLMVTVGYRGVHSLKFSKLAPYSDLLASSAIVLCGVLIVLGL